MNPYPQKPNVTRTSKHEGSYSYEGMPREYKSKEEILKDYMKDWLSGKLDDNMKSYLTNLNGGTPPPERDRYMWHREARKLLSQAEKYVVHIARDTNISYTALKEIGRGEFDRVPFDQARETYYQLKKAL